MSDPLHGCDVSEVCRGARTIVIVRPAADKPPIAMAAGQNPAEARALASELMRDIRAASAAPAGA